MMNATDIRELKAPRLSKQDRERLFGAAVFEPDHLDQAIVGVLETPEGFVALYDYDRLCYYVRDGEDPDSTPESAQEWVDFNMVRALPYIRPRAPRIGLWVNNEDGEEYGDDVEYIHHGGKIYVRL
jgi:hypothetical protein